MLESSQNSVKTFRKIVLSKLDESIVYIYFGIGGMPDYLLKTLVQSSFSLTAPDELDGSSTVGDTLSPILLARAAFFTFLLMGNGIGLLYTKTLT